MSNGPANSAGCGQASFEALFAEHRQTLHAYFLGKTGDAELALDLVQDTFVRVWRNMSTLDGLGSERQKAWIFSVARNLVVDQYRSRATRASTEQALVRLAASAEQFAASPEAEVERLALIASVDRAIHELPPDLRMVLVLQVVAERNSTEIGELLGRPPGTVRYQLAEARRRLARSLQLGEMVNA